MTSQTKLQNRTDSVQRKTPPFIVKIFASALFSGYSPIASGTVGSMVALCIYFIPGFETPIVCETIILVTLLLGIRAAGIMEAYYGHDPAEVTIDEVVGMWISLFFLPKNILVALCAFFIFRFFDIIKPFPARKIDSMSGGFGIMMDDVVAGIYTNIFLQLIFLLRFIHNLFV